MQQEVRLVIAVLAVATTFRAVGMTQSGTAAPNAQAEPTHGTINVFLANKNGLVAVTDSKLSNDSGPRGYAQKLFRVDDHTICTIAGWYSDLGPGIRADATSQPSFPASVAVPSIIRSAISTAEFGSLSLGDKMKRLSNVFKVALLAVADLRERAGIPLARPASGSEITLAGFNSLGILEILQADLAPEIRDGRIVGYVLTEKPPILVSETVRLVWVFRGITGAAQTLLDCTYPSMEGDLTIGNFRTALGGDGEPLTLSDMERVAIYLERRTAEEFPAKVGGDLQVAELAAGKITRFVEPIKEPPFTRLVSFRWSHMRADRPGIGQPLVDNESGEILFFTGADLADGLQGLDNFIFFNSTFTRVRFEYYGGDSTIFDRSNTVVDSTLTLYPGADPNSNFVKRIRADFPQLKIFDYSKPSQK